MTTEQWRVHAVCAQHFESCYDGYRLAGCTSWSFVLFINVVSRLRFLCSVTTMRINYRTVPRSVTGSRLFCKLINNKVDKMVDDFCEWTKSRDPCNVLIRLDKVLWQVLDTREYKINNLLYFDHVCFYKGCDI